MKQNGHSKAGPNSHLTLGLWRPHRCGWLPVVALWVPKANGCHQGTRQPTGSPWLRWYYQAVFGKCA